MDGFGLLVQLSMGLTKYGLVRSLSGEHWCPTMFLRPRSTSSLAVDSKSNRVKPIDRMSLTQIDRLIV